MRQARKSLAHVPSTDVSGDKENVGGSSAALSSLTAQGKQASKKSRSKSLGPGGLDALKESTGNKQEVGHPSLRKMFDAQVIQPVLPPQFKSILKPTIPLSPPKTIPPHHGVGRASPGKSSQAAPAGKSPRRAPADTPMEPSQSLSNPFEASPALKSAEVPSPTRVAVRTEEEQQAAARERERQEILAHKDARRKSLGNITLILQVWR